MANGKLLRLAFIFSLLTLLLVLPVKADFSYNERYNSYSRQYDTWVYDIDIDDEDTRVIVRHVWSSPSYKYDYDTNSNREYEYGPTRSEDRRIVSLNRPSSSNDIGRDLISYFTSNRYYSNYGSYGYYRNYW